MTTRSSERTLPAGLAERAEQIVSAAQSDGPGLGFYRVMVHFGFDDASARHMSEHIVTGEGLLPLLAATVELHGPETKTSQASRAQAITVAGLRPGAPAWWSEALGRDVNGGPHGLVAYNWEPMPRVVWSLPDLELPEVLPACGRQVAAGELVVPTEAALALRESGGAGVVLERKVRQLRYGALRHRAGRDLIRVAAYFSFDRSAVSFTECLVRSAGLLECLRVLKELHYQSADGGEVLPTLFCEGAFLYGAGPYWWSTPGLRGNGSPRGAMVYDWYPTSQELWLRPGVTLPSCYK